MQAKQTCRALVDPPPSYPRHHSLPACYLPQGPDAYGGSLLLTTQQQQPAAGGEAAGSRSSSRHSGAGGGGKPIKYATLRRQMLEELGCASDAVETKTSATRNSASKELEGITE